jgi:hypothetical protein
MTVSPLRYPRKACVSYGLVILIRNRMRTYCSMSTLGLHLSREVRVSLRCQLFSFIVANLFSFSNLSTDVRRTDFGSASPDVEAVAT